MCVREGGARAALLIFCLILCIATAVGDAPENDGTREQELSPDLLNENDLAGGMLTRRTGRLSMDNHPDLHQSRDLLDKNDVVSAVLKTYLDNMPMQEHLKGFVTRCGHISRLKSLGKTVKGFNIWALEISDKPGRSEPEPHIKIIGNVHGDEPSGRMVTIAFAEWLCKNYDKDEDAQLIVNNVHLWLVPSMNPDAFAVKTRENYNGKDLNRDFPDRFSNPYLEPTGDEEPETSVIMNWLLQQHFVASLALHEGATVVSYPMDGNAENTNTYEAAEDDETFKFLAKGYANAHATMALPSNSEFPEGGITNGAAWYSIYGSMQDWNYLRAGCMELTLELSESKWPAEEELPTIFNANLPAMVQFIKTTAFGGVRGKIVVETGALRKDKAKEVRPIEANVTIEGSNFVVKSSSAYGDYYRPLAPGKYTVVVRREGYPTARSNVTVPADGRGVVRDFVMREKKVNADGSTLNSAETQRNHNMILLLSGVGVMWGLWIVHKRMVRRQASSMRQRYN